MTFAIPIRRLTAAAAAVLLAATGLASGAASAAPNPSVFYSVPFSSDLYVLGDVTDEGVDVRVATFHEWSAAGTPRPVPAPTRYKAYEWSPNVFAEIELGEYAYAEQLDFTQWVRGGSRTPSRNTLIVGTELLRWATSPALVVYNPFERSDSPLHNLTYGQWQRLGFATPTFLSNEGFQKLSWAPSIALMSDISAGQGQPIAFAEWAYFGFQQPQAVNRFPNDSFCATPGSPDVKYVGPVYPDGLVISYSQWRAAGSPAPAAC